MLTQITEDSPTPLRKRVVVLGATGTIGRAVVRVLLQRGYEALCILRPGSAATVPPAATAVAADVADPAALARAFAAARCDAIISCMASRTGAPADAWAIDYIAQANALSAARAHGVAHFVLLSAICVQKPLLAFQKAKLAFESDLIASGVEWSIVRPTAFFKSLSGQVARVAAGRPFVMFGDGTLTACKPISDDDLADYLVDCLNDDTRRNRILPIGGPGDAITPRAQGEALFALLGRRPHFRHVPLALLDGIVGTLGLVGRIVPRIADKAEFARIGRYYATESMLVFDAVAGRYDADATPSTGTQTLLDHYARIIGGQARAERGAHSVF